jgi:hypothetical protein
MRLHLFLVLLFFLFNAPLAAQPDTSFIELFDNNARINTGLRYKNNSLTFSTPAGEKFKLESKGLAFRLGGRYKQASYTFSIPVSDLGTGTEDRQGKSFSLGLTLFLRNQLLAGRFRNTRGFRSVTPEGESVFREDVDLFSAQLYGFHVLNNKRFSLRSSFKQRDRQLKSQGSFLLGGLIDRQLLTSDGIYGPFEDGQEKLIRRAAQTKFGIGLGYAYSFHLGNHFFITPFAIVGPEFRFQSFDVVNNARREREQLRVSPRIRSYLALGWNGKRTAVAITSTYLPTLDVSENLDTRNNQLTVELRITRRFLYPD